MGIVPEDRVILLRSQKSVNCDTPGSEQALDGPFHKGIYDNAGRQATAELPCPYLPEEF